LGPKQIQRKKSSHK